MASYHFSAQIISRSKGRSAIAAAAYRAGAQLRDESSGQVFDYRRRRGVVHTEVMLPEGAAPWLADRERLWNHAAQLERRKDAQLARECNLALPHELDHAQRLELLRGFVAAQFTSRGMVADLAVHAPTDNDDRNHHAHVMLTLRKGTPSGLHRVKTREWNSDSLLKEWREAWADWQNAFLARGEHRGRVDHRTLAAQRTEATQHGDRAAAAALDRQPEIHVGVRAQHAGRRSEPPRSQARAQQLRRPANGAWRSSGSTGKRERFVHYPRIDRGTRSSFNASRSQSSAAGIGRLVRGLQQREARLRLVQIRYDQRIRDRESVLKNLLRSAGSTRSSAERARLFGVETHVRQQLLQYRRRSQLLRLLIGRTDKILAGMFRFEGLALARSQSLAKRLSAQPKVSRRQGRGQAMRMSWL